MTETVISKARTRVHWTAAERDEWLAMFEKSAQTAAAFCRRTALPSHGRSGDRSRTHRIGRSSI
jgi:hypothetical protein